MVLFYCMHSAVQLPSPKTTPASLLYPLTNQKPTHTNLEGGADDLRLGQAQAGHEGLDRSAEEEADPPGARAGVVGDGQDDGQQPAHRLPRHFTVLVRLGVMIRRNKHGRSIDPLIGQPMVRWSGGIREGVTREVSFAYMPLCKKITTDIMVSWLWLPGLLCTKSHDNMYVRVVNGTITGYVCRYMRITLGWSGGARWPLADSCWRTVTNGEQQSLHQIQLTLPSSGCDCPM